MPKSDAQSNHATRGGRQGSNEHGYQSHSDDARSTSHANREAESLRTNRQIERLIQSILEYTVHLFSNKGMPAHSKAADGQASSSTSDTEDTDGRKSLQVDDISRLILGEVIQYAVRQYFRKRRVRLDVPKSPRQTFADSYRQSKESADGQQAVPVSGNSGNSGSPGLRSQPGPGRADARSTGPSARLARQRATQPVPLPSPPGAFPTSPRHSFSHVGGGLADRAHRNYDSRPASRPHRQTPSTDTRERERLSAIKKQSSALDTETDKTARVLLIALDDLLVQLRGTDDLVYGTMRLPTSAASHGRYDTRKTAMEQAVDLQYSISRVSGGVRRVRDLLLAARGGRGK